MGVTVQWKELTNAQKMAAESEICRLYENGKSVRQIMVALDTSKGNTQNILKRNGLVMRSGAELRSKISETVKGLHISGHYEQFDYSRSEASKEKNRIGALKQFSDRSLEDRKILEAEICRLFTDEDLLATEIQVKLDLSAWVVASTIQKNGLTRPKRSPSEKTRRKISEGIHKSLMDGTMVPNSSASKKGKITWYSGIRMRSTTEAKTALILDRENIVWQYEPKRFDLGCCTYLPDFYLPEEKVWIEVKGWMDETSQHKVDTFRLLGFPLVVAMHKEVVDYDRFITEDVL